MQKEQKLNRIEQLNEEHKLGSYVRHKLLLSGVPLPQYTLERY